MDVMKFTNLNVRQSILPANFKKFSLSDFYSLQVHPPT